jgi:hypothetical protein
MTTEWEIPNDKARGNEKRSKEKSGKSETVAGLQGDKVGRMREIWDGCGKGETKERRNNEGRHIHENKEGKKSERSELLYGFAGVFGFLKVSEVGKVGVSVNQGA